MMPWKKLSVLAFCAVPLVACGGDEPIETGEVALQWQVGPHGCAEAGAATMVVTEVDAESGSTAWQFRCEDREATLSDLKPGTWSFVLEAQNAAGETVYRGETGIVQVRPGGMTLAPPVALQAAPAELFVQWNFGGPLCGQVGVSDVDVFAYDGYGTVEQGVRTGCEIGTAELEVRPGPYDVVVQGIDVDERVLYESVFEAELTRGTQHVETIVLEPVER